MYNLTRLKYHVLLRTRIVREVKYYNYNMDVYMCVNVAIKQQIWTSIYYGSERKSSNDVDRASRIKT